MARLSTSRVYDKDGFQQRVLTGSIATAKFGKDSTFLDEGSDGYGLVQDLEQTGYHVVAGLPNYNESSMDALIDDTIRRRQDGIVSYILMSVEFEPDTGQIVKPLGLMAVSRGSVHGQRERSIYDYSVLSFVLAAGLEYLECSGIFIHMMDMSCLQLGGRRHRYMWLDLIDPPSSDDVAHKAVFSAMTGRGGVDAGLDLRGAYLAQGQVFRPVPLNNQAEGSSAYLLDGIAPNGDQAERSSAYTSGGATPHRLIDRRGLNP